jgi:hypothetical protein
VRADLSQRYLVVYVDARRDGFELGRAIVQGAAREQRRLAPQGVIGIEELAAATAITAALLKSFSFQVGCEIGPMIKVDPKPIAELLLTEDTENIDPGTLATIALENLVKVAGKRQVIVIIDEANMMLDMSGAYTPEQKSKRLSEVRQVLAKIVQMTKQDRSLNVVMASSDYLLPHRLSQKVHPVSGQNTDLGISAKDFSHRIFAGEVIHP